ncbi:hypothetical protein AWV80_24800 [Cupriavidus sp. UYMU48A]|nr:hypothetical protein AWV80_24800 [Cupriavidus sp. UYMU48A]
MLAQSIVLISQQYPATAGSTGLRAVSLHTLSEQPFEVGHLSLSCGAALPLPIACGALLMSSADRGDAAMADFVSILSQLLTMCFVLLP